MLKTFHQPLNIAVIGASGAIGGALCRHLIANDSVNTLYALSRRELDWQDDAVTPLSIDLESEQSIEQAAQQIQQPLDLVIVATGVLHGESFKPEKQLSDLTPESLQTVLYLNTIAPALVAKHFLPRLNHQHKSVFAALSARVGSISDNRMGGWYAYRTSKAALNMIIKNLAIETSRRYRQSIVIGLHPGTVDSALSKPHTSNTPKEKLFTPDYAAQCLLKVIDDVTPEDAGKCFAWDGQEVPA